MSTTSFRWICVALFGLAQLGVLYAQEPVRARDLFLAGSEKAASPGAEQPVGAKSDKTIKGVPLGLRYSIVKSAGGGQASEVDPDTVFHSGDRIRLNIQSNDRGYLYIVMRGSSGRWSLLFPSKEILAGNNLVEKGKQYEIPLGSVWFAFDEQPGVEKLFLVLARTPEPDLDKLIDSLRPPPPTSPGTDKKPAGSVQVVSSVDDATVNKIRGQVATRDLVFEKVNNEERPGQATEKAVYVVNQTGSNDSRVVIDLSLNHQ
jgi:hypothetical protein